MPKAWIETAVGLFVVAGMAALFMLAMQVSNLSMWQGKGYDLIAYFENIGGLKVRAPVTLAGVTIGRVAAIELDKSRYEAKVTLRIDPRYDNLPRDTSASIYTAGLLGENYVALEPGGEEAFLRPGDEIKLTQSAVILERLIGQFLFEKAQGGTP